MSATSQLTSKCRFERMSNHGRVRNRATADRDSHTRIFTCGEAQK